MEKLRKPLDILSYIIYNKYELQNKEVKSWLKKKLADQQVILNLNPDRSGLTKNAKVFWKDIASKKVYHKQKGLEGELRS